MDLFEDLSEVNFTNDKVKSFLLTKLEEIRLSNEALEITINQQKESPSATPDILMEEVNVALSENEPWIKIFNSKYIVGFQIRNFHTEKTLNNSKVFLSWNSKETFCYEVKLFGSRDRTDCNEGDKCSLITDTVVEDSFSNIGLYVIIVFDVPSFLDQNEYTISGIIISNVDQIHYTLNLPEVTISPKDFTLQNLQINNQPELCYILSRISCSKETQVMMSLPDDWSATLNGTFEIYCSLTKLQVNVSCKQYYFAKKVSCLFNESLVIVHPENKECQKSKVLKLKIYTTSQTQLIALLHHLHLCVPNSIILPMEYGKAISTEKSYQLQEDFKNNIHKELEFINKIVTGNVYSKSQLRKNLSEIEKNTDQAYVNILNMKY